MACACLACGTECVKIYHQDCNLTWQMVPNLNILQMHLQCNCNVQIYVIAANSIGNSKFVIKFAHNKNLKYKLRICQVYKSEALVDNKDLCVMQIPNMPWKFAVSIVKVQIWQWIAVFANWIAYLNITNALWMHLCNLQIQRHLPWS